MICSLVWGAELCGAPVSGACRGIVKELGRIRYLIHNDPYPALFASEGLPIAPFQTTVQTSPAQP